MLKEHGKHLIVSPNRILIILIGFFMSCFYLTSQAQNEVSATIRVLPAYSVRISDYADNPQNIIITLRNNSQRNLFVYLAGSITGENGIEVRTHPQYRATQNIQLNAFEIKTLDGFAIRNLFDVERLVFSGISKAALVRGNGLPEGIYTICLRAHDAQTNEQLSGDEPIGCSNPINVTNLEPPILINPHCDTETVSGYTPQNVLFTWTFPAGAPPDTEYYLTIVEMLDPRKNPNDAFLSATTPVFFEERVMGNAFLYGPAQPTLVAGRRYAYAVTAKDPNNRLVFRNGGRSEVCSFFYQPLEVPKLGISSVPDVKSNQWTKAYVIPKTKITGKVVWSFRKTEAGSQVGSLTNPATVLATSGNSLQAALIDPTYGAEKSGMINQQLLGTTTNLVIKASNAGESPQLLQPDKTLVNRLFVSKPAGTAAAIPVVGVPVSSVTVSSVVSSHNINNSVITQLADNKNEFPLSNTIIKVVSGGLYNSGQPLAAIKTDEEGNFSIEFVNPNYSSYSSSIFNNVNLVIDDEHFIFEKIKVDLNAPNQSEIKLGTIRGLAKTFRLEPTVKDIDDKNLKLNNVNVEVFRPSYWHSSNPSLKREGNIAVDGREEEHINGILMTKIASGKGTTAISKLFFNKKGFGDQYYVRVTAENYNSLIVPLMIAPQGDYENGIVSIPQTYNLIGKLPEIYGRVTRADNFAPMAGVTVVIKKMAKSSGTVAVTIPVEKFLSSTYNYGTVSTSGGSSGGTTSAPASSIPLAGSIQSGLMNQVIQVSATDLSSTASVNQSGRVLFGDGISGAALPTGPSSTVNYRSGSGSTGNVSGVIAKNSISEISASDYTAIINAVPKEGLTYATAVTDEDGNYRIANIKPDENPYEILVIGKSIKSNEPRTVLLNSKGLSVEQDIRVNMTLVEVKGKIVNDQDEPLSNVLVRWKSGGESVYSDALGQFNIKSVPGADVLSLRRTGHNDHDQTIVISIATSQDLGTFTLFRLVGRLIVTVQDKISKAAIPDATVLVGADEISGVTKVNGAVFFEGAIGGDIPVKVKGPASQDYIPTLPQTVSVSFKGGTTKITLELSMGARATGTVRSGGNPVSGATVRVDGRDDLYATTATDGSYTLRGIPLGEYKLKAVKSGLIGASATKNFVAGSNTLDFNLNNSGIDIATLLGFPIEVELFSEADMTISGAFINIPGNSLFKLPAGMRLPFSNIKVKKVGNAIEPVSGEVQTDIPDIRLKIFDYMTVVAKNPAGIVVRKSGSDASKGDIVAKVGIDYSSLQGALYGWTFQSPDAHFLKTNASSTAEITIFTSTGILPFSQDSLLLGASGNQQLKLYGFGVNLDLGKSSLKANGFHIRGTVKLTGIPLLSDAAIDLRHLWIAPDGTVKNATLGLNPAPKIDLSVWSLTLNAAQLGEMGFRLGGSMDITLPSSPKSTLTFSNLSASVDQLFGGEFTMPSAGINVFNIVSFKTAPYSKIGFTRVPNSNVYAISGNAVVTFPKYIDKTLDIKNFVVQTDGRFMATIPANYKADFFGLASFEINNIAFKNLAGAPGIDITGGMSLSAIPFITASAGGIRFGTGGKVSVDKINLGFSMASVAEVKVGVGFMDTPERKGFEGSGSLSVASTPFGGAIQFHYYRSAGSDIEFGAEFAAATPPIVLSPVTTITKVGGGFGYSYDSKAGKKKYRITVRGAMSVAPGTDLLIALDPLEVSVESGPVIKGLAAVTVVGQKVASAKLLIDIPNTLFNLEAQFGVGFLQDIGVKNEGGAILVISGKPSDAYWMVGTYFRIDVLGLIQNNGYMAAGWNLNINAHPELGSYTNFIPHDFRSNGTSLNGVHFKAMSHFGLTRENAACGDIAGVAGGCIWFYNKADAVINANFVMRKMGIMVGTSWGGGAEITIAGQSIAGASIGAGLSVAGSYGPADGWYFNGNGNAHLSAWFGSCTQACETKVCWGGCFDVCPVIDCEICPIPIGGKICVNPGLSVTYSSKRGAKVSVDL